MITISNTLSSSNNNSACVMSLCLLIANGLTLLPPPPYSVLSSVPSVGTAAEFRSFQLQIAIYEHNQARAVEQ